jgi:hypothetical protein
VTLLVALIGILCVAVFLGEVLPRVAAALVFGFFAFGSFQCFEGGAPVTAGVLLGEGIALAWLFVAMSRLTRKTLAEVTAPRGQTQEQR